MCCPGRTIRGLFCALIRSFAETKEPRGGARSTHFRGGLRGEISRFFFPPGKPQNKQLRVFFPTVLITLLARMLRNVSVRFSTRGMYKNSFLFYSNGGQSRISSLRIFSSRDANILTVYDTRKKPWPWRNQPSRIPPRCKANFHTFPATLGGFPPRRNHPETNPSPGPNHPPLAVQ